MGFVNNGASSSSSGNNKNNDEKNESKAKMRRRLSRSLSFRLQDNEDDFEVDRDQNDADVDNEIALAVAPLDHIVLGEFEVTYSPPNYGYNYGDNNIFRHEIPAEGRRMYVVDNNDNHYRRGKKPKTEKYLNHFQLTYRSLAEGERLLYYHPMLSYEVTKLFPHVCNAEGVTSECIFWFKATVQGGGSYKLVLQVRWPNADFASLETPEAIEEKFVGMYWANGGRPFKFQGESAVLENIEDGTTCLIEDLKIPPTFDIIPCPQPDAPFALELYDYQLRTLAWMQGIEDGEPALFYAPNVVKLNDDHFIDIDERTFGSAKELLTEDKNVYSGIIADKPGVGKTITTVALLHTRQFDDENYLYTLKNDRIRSRATLILAPNNICEQWVQEIKKCLGDTVSVLQIKGKAQYVATSLEDVLTHDIVVVSYSFLANGVYKGAKNTGRELSNYTRKFNFEEKPEDIKTFVEGRKKGDYAFTWVHFHRVVCDEFHEISDKGSAIRLQLLEMSADYMWGLTGTPRLESTETVVKFADYLNIDATSNWLHPDFEAHRFILQRVRRNEPEIQFPEPIFDNIHVVQNPMEYSFYRSCVATSDVVQLLMLCNHYQIGVAADATMGFETLTIEQVTEKVQANRADQIESLEKQIKTATEALEEAKEKLLDLQDDLRVGLKNPKKTDKQIEALQNKVNNGHARVAGAEEAIRRLQVELQPIQAQFNYFQNFVDSYLSKSGEDINCAICLEDSIVGDLGIIPCGHVFCWGCTDEVVRQQLRCPTCRVPAAANEILKLPPPKAKEEPIPEADETEPEGGKLDPNKFGSKIRELVSYLRRTAEEDDSYRFIVFIQFANLADLVSQALNTYGIETARLKKGWNEREKALRMFRAGLKTNAAVEQTDAVTVEEEKKEEESGTGADTEVLEGDENEEVRKVDKGKRKAEPETSTKKKQKVEKKVRDKPVKVLMLSARDSVSGLNLTEASHCIILHPFHSAVEDYAIAAEKQGVARVLRNGQTKTVKIVRFVVDNTVEEDIHSRRLEFFGGIQGMSVDR